jgi:Glycosyl transferase 4-like domain
VRIRHRPSAPAAEAYATAAGTSSPAPQREPAILSISPSFTPDTTPTAIRAGKVLAQLSAQRDVTVLTQSRSQQPDGQVRVQVVRGRRPSRLLATVRRLRMSKLLELAVWPDESIFWVLPAILAGRRVIRESRPSVIVVFMMPYSGGLVGVALSRLSGLPLILNLDDSPTCTDMHPHFPTRLHYRLARALEDFYVRRADAIVYVSQTNLESVRARQPAHAHDKFKLVRYGADSADFRAQPPRGTGFEIAYVGAMSGWWSLVDEHTPTGPLARLYGAWMRLGRHQRTMLDQRTSSPAIIGRAILEAIAGHPDWEGRVKLTIHGNPYPAPLVSRALASAGVESVVDVFGPVPHAEIADIIARADLLFITLPKRLDGSPGGRISAKTYEYLATDRPILAAVPRGENWDYLAGKPGVWLVAPDDCERMREVIAELADAKFSGNPRTFAREHLHEEISYRTRASELAGAIAAGIEHKRTAPTDTPRQPAG